MTIAKAFRIRNALKAKYAEKLSAYDTCTKSWEVGTIPDYSYTNGKTAMQIEESMLDINRILLILNIEINKANFLGGAQDILLKIENLHNMLTHAEYKDYFYKAFKQEKEVINCVTGLVDRVVKYETSIKPADTLSSMALIKKHKFDLESELADINARTIVNLSEADYKKIDEVLSADY